MSVADSSEASELPDELVKVARQNQCSPVANFHANLLGWDYVEKNPPPYGIPPPYAYGYAEAGKKADSAVFWCESDTDGCPNVIKWLETAKNLTVYKDVGSTLDMYVHVGDETRSGPKGVRPTRNGVRSYATGAPHFEHAVSEYFYCHEGKWLVRQELQH